MCFLRGFPTETNPNKSFIRFPYRLVNQRDLNPKLIVSPKIQWGKLTSFFRTFKCQQISWTLNIKFKLKIAFSTFTKVLYKCTTTIAYIVIPQKNKNLNR